MLAQQTYINWPNEVNRFGSTDMHVAAAQGDVLLLQTLLSGGRDPNVQNSKGITPLHNAVVNGQLECVELLISAKSSPFITDSMGHTAIDKISIVLEYPGSFSKDLIAQYHEINSCLKRLRSMSLTHLCRDKILSCLVSLDESVITSLPIPNKLHSFLQYQVSEEIQSEIYTSSLIGTAPHPPQSCKHPRLSDTKNKCHII